jgi:hypothetical protein
MCRSTIDGGRRCPSHTDPALISNRNARRREKYAKSHSKVKSLNSEVGESSLHSVASSSFEHSLFSYKQFGYDIATETKPIYQKVNAGSENAFGLTTSEYEGLLVDKGYIAKKQNSGLLNYTKLDENSYREFGFKEPSISRYSQIQFGDLTEMSKAELKNHSFAEKKALRTFTSNDYAWINSSLYGKTGLKEESAKEEANYVPQYGDDLDNADHLITDPEDRTPSRFKEIVSALDRALDKGPKQQRILYRGMSGYHNAWGTPEGLKQYVEKNYGIGKEFKFDGYQSTTYSPMQALGSASGGGVIFEISTPSGVNVTSVSKYSTEEEAILSRDARYMIVGLHQNVTYSAQASEDSKYPDKRYDMTVVQMVEITDDGYVKDETNFTPPAPLKPEQLSTSNVY